MEFLHSAELWIVVAALSEIIAISPLKDNSVVQLIMSLITKLKPVKK